MRGQSSVSWRARPGVVARSLTAQSEVMLAVTLPPCVLASIEAAWDLALGMTAAVVVPLVGMFVSRRLPPPDDVRRIEALATLVLMFLIVAVLPLPAFMALGMPPLDAIFESVSAITTTGLTVAEDAMSWPLAGHFLRSWMQWCGGLAIAVAGVALILGPGPAAHEMGEASISERDILTSTRAQARELLVVYVILTAAACLGFAVLFPTWWEGVAIALTAVSTGGFTPRADSLASYSVAAQVAVMIVSLSTAFSLLAYVRLRRKGWRDALLGTNAATMLVLCATGALLVATIKAALVGFETEAVLDSVLNFLSGFTTAGFSVAPVDDAAPIVALILVAMTVGGGVGSTAGGIKIDRVMIFARMVRLSLVRLRSPRRAVTYLSERGRRVAADRIIATAAVAFLYVVSAMVAWLVFLASDLPPLAALFDIVSALSTVGLSTGVTSAELADHLKAVLIVAMLLGRLEFLALIAVLSPITWAGRS